MKHHFLSSFLLATFLSISACSGAQGEQGPAGRNGVSIVSIAKTSSDGLVDTYTIIYSDGTTSTFTVINGADGLQGEQGIQGNPGEDGHTPVVTIGSNGNWYVDGEDTGIQAQGQKEDSLKSIYGVRWSVADNSDCGERCFDAIGLHANIGIGDALGFSDFDYIYPWSDIKRCNIRINSNGSYVLTYEGEDGFAVDGSNGDVFVRIPKFKVSRFIRDGYEYRVIGDQNSPTHEAFIEDGKELNEIFIGAYEGTLIDNALHSYGGAIPSANLTGPDYLTAARKNGTCYSLYDMRCVDALWTLMSVEYGKRNSNRILGYGYSDYFQPVSNEIMVCKNAINTNSIEVQYDGNKLEDGFKRWFPVGSTITICDTTQTNVVGVRIIASVVDSLNSSIISFNGEPLTVTTKCFVGSGGCVTNLCETCSLPLRYHTGRAEFIQNSIVQNPIRYRWVENICGSLWHHLPDVTFNYLQAYVCKNMKDYEFGNHSGSYVPLGDILPANDDNGNKNDIEGRNCWVTSLMNDPFAQYLSFGKTYEKTLSSEKAFGAYYYLYNEAEMHIVNGGGFDHLWRSNILTNRAWTATSFGWYLYGSRLMFKDVR